MVAVRTKLESRPKSEEPPGFPNPCCRGFAFRAHRHNPFSAVGLFKCYINNTFIELNDLRDGSVPLFSKTDCLVIRCELVEPSRGRLRPNLS